MPSSFCIDLPVVDSSVAVSPCEGCHAGCCRAFSVPITLGDIFRIATERRLDFWDFVARWADESGAISRGYAPQFFFEDDPETPFVIGLLHADSVAFPGTTCCSFLKESVDDSGRVTGQCSIYESRPDACRLFPAVTDRTGDTRLHDVPEFGRPDQNEAFRLCPTEWSIEHIDLDAHCDATDRCQSEMELMRLLAERWNQSPGAWQVFPDFLAAVHQSVYGDAVV